MADTVHLVVEKGPNKGKQISVLAEGVRVGRSSKNDVVLEDPLLSRHHCRLFFKPGEGLWVTDLGSANGTLVNGNTITEVRLRIGDRIAIGDTVLEVLTEDVGGVQAAPGAGIKVAGGPVVDLGLKSEKEKQEGGQRKSPIGLLSLMASFAIAIAVGIWLPKFLMKGKAQKKKPPAQGKADEQRLHEEPGEVHRGRRILLVVR